MKTPLILEKHIEQTIVQCMELDGWRSLKMEQNFSERKRKVTGEVGMADRLFIRYGVALKARLGYFPQLVELMFWEFKANSGNPSQPQCLWIAAERARGALVWLAGVDHPATIEGAAQHYLDSGLCRRRELFEKLIPHLGRTA